MMKAFFTYLRLLTVLVAMPLFSASAQDITVKATVDTNVISIGEQFRLELVATYPAEVMLQWPALADTFQGFEVIRRSEIDTLKSENGLLSRKQHFIITSFDSGYKIIPPLSAIATGPGTGDTLRAETDPLLIRVNTFEVDTTRSIKDIKDLVRYPYTWQDSLPWIFGGLLLVLLVWLVYYVLKNRKKPGPVKIAEPRIPPHEKAMSELKRIEMEKIWQQGNYKLYHTRVTDVVRVYLQETRNVNAPEMTTNEILSLNIINSLSINKYNSIKSILELADLVKFAKVHPLPADNEQSMHLAVSFISEDSAVHSEPPKPVS